MILWIFIRTDNYRIFQKVIEFLLFIWRKIEYHKKIMDILRFFKEKTKMSKILDKRHCFLVIALTNTRFFKIFGSYTPIILKNKIHTKFFEYIKNPIGSGKF